MPRSNDTRLPLAGVSRPSRQTIAGRVPSCITLEGELARVRELLGLRLYNQLVTSAELEKRVAELEPTGDDAETVPGLEAVSR